jgi:hypothetical protein
MKLLPVGESGCIQIINSTSPIQMQQQLFIETAQVPVSSLNTVIGTGLVAIRAR